MSLAAMKEKSQDNSLKHNRHTIANKGGIQDDNEQRMFASNDNHNSLQLPSIQREPVCSCDGGCPTCKNNQRKDSESQDFQSALQPKLKTNEQENIPEKEADRVADLAMRIHNLRQEHTYGDSSGPI